MVKVVSLENKVSDVQVTRVLITNQEFHKLQIQMEGLPGLLEVGFTYHLREFLDLGFQIQLVFV